MQPSSVKTNTFTAFLLLDITRKPFPVFEYDIKGLDPKKVYTIYLDFVAVDSNEWKHK